MKHGTGTLWTLNPFPGDVPCGGERGGCLRISAYKRQKESLHLWKLEKIRSLGSWFRGMEPTHTKSSYERRFEASIGNEQGTVSEYVSYL